MLASDQYEIDPCWLYPTHVERSQELMRAVIALTKQGSHVDIDVQNEDLVQWVGFYIDNGGDLSKLTVSSDASIKGPDTFFGQIRALARSHRLPLAKLLAFVTRNTAEVLKLKGKGCLEVGADGDILVLERDNFELVHVLARSKRMVTDVQVAVREQFLEKSNRRIALRGGEEIDRSGIADVNANQEPLEAGSPA